MMYLRRYKRRLSGCEDLLLAGDQRTKATYVFSDVERVRWHWTTPRNFPRNGLPLRDMNVAQRDLALVLLQTSVSQAGYQKALDIISLQTRHFTLVGEQVGMTPFFLGAWPTLSDTGLRAMPREEDAARELVLSLDESSRTLAIFRANSLTHHLTQNQPYLSTPGTSPGSWRPRFAGWPRASLPDRHTY